MTFACPCICLDQARCAKCPILHSLHRRGTVTSLTSQNIRISPVCPISLCLCSSRSSHRSLTVLPLQVLCNFCRLHVCRLVADKTLWCREHDCNTSVSACAQRWFHYYSTETRLCCCCWCCSSQYPESIFPNPWLGLELSCDQKYRYSNTRRDPGLIKLTVDSQNCVIPIIMLCFSISP